MTPKQCKCSHAAHAGDCAPPGCGCARYRAHVPVIMTAPRVVAGDVVRELPAAKESAS